MNDQPPNSDEEALGSDDAQPGEPESGVVELDPAQAALLRQRLEAEQNLPLAILGGAAASVAGAAVWAGISLVTKYQITFMAIGIGFLVGFAVRRLGKGVTTVFGIAGAGLALIGCFLGNLLTVTALVASQFGVPFRVVLFSLDPQMVFIFMRVSFSPLDLIFYGLAVYCGFRYSFRQLTDGDLNRLLPGGIGPS